MPDEKDGAGIEVDEKFTVGRQHLLGQLTVEDAEAREFVIDPLRGVPELPFGHLHAAWKEFLKGHADGSELWSFSGRWQTWWNQELRSGYVLVRNGSSGAQFLTFRKYVKNDAETEEKLRRAREKMQRGDQIYELPWFLKRQGD